MARKARRAIKQKQKQTVIVNIGTLRPRRRAAATSLANGLRSNRPSALHYTRPGTQNAPVAARSETFGTTLINAGFADHYARVNAMALDDFRRGIAAAARETPAQHEAEERELARGGQLSRLVAEADDMRLLNLALTNQKRGLEGEIIDQRRTMEEYYRGEMAKQASSLKVTSELLDRMFMAGRDRQTIIDLDADAEHDRTLAEIRQRRPLQAPGGPDTPMLMASNLQIQVDGMTAALSRNKGEEGGEEEEKAGPPSLFNGRAEGTVSETEGPVSDAEGSVSRNSGMRSERFEQSERRREEAVTRLRGTDARRWSNSRIVLDARNLGIRVSGDPPDYELLRAKISEEVGAIGWLYE